MRMGLQLSLRARMVMLVMGAIVPLLAGAIYHMLQDAEEALHDATSRLTSMAALASASQESSARSGHQLLVSIASVPGFVQATPQTCQAYLGQLRKQFTLYTNLGIANTDGSLRCDALGSPPGMSLADRTYFRRALESKKFAIGEYTMGRLSRKQVLTFGMPMLDASGQIGGVLFAAVDLAVLSTLGEDAPLEPGAQLQILDRQGVVLLARPPLPELIGQTTSSPLLREAAQSMAAGLDRGDDGKGNDMLYAYQPSLRSANSPFFIAVSMPRGEVVTPIRIKLALQLTLVAAIALLSGWIAWLAGGRSIVSPALKILQTTRQIRRGDLDARIDLGGLNPGGELSRIAAGVNLMADALQQRERDFTNELAHSRQAYSTLALTINSMQEGLIAIDTAGTPLLINETAATLFSMTTSSTILSGDWSLLQGLFWPGTERLFKPEELPLHLALNGQSGGPLRMLMRNERMPEGRLLSCTYRAMMGPEGIVGAMMLFSDITEVARLQAEQEKSYIQLRDTQRRLLDAQRIGRIGIWELDLDTQRIWWSPEVYEIFGVSPQDFTGSPTLAADLMHPEDRERYESQRERALGEGLVLDIEYRIITPDGQLRWIHQVGQLYATSPEEKHYRGGVVQEITERKNAELVLSRATELLNRTGQMARVGGWEVDLATLDSYWSEEIYRIHEIDPALGLDPRQALNFYPPDSQPEFRRAVRDAVANGTPWNMELPLITARGRQIWVLSQGRALREGGKVVRLVGALQDITERREAQEHLRLLESSISRLNDMVLITEAEPIGEPGPRIVFVNQAFERRTGYRREDVIGKSPRFLQGPKTQRAELDRIATALRTWQPVQAELINYTSGGEEYWIEMDIVPLMDNKGWFTHWVAVERDITLRKLSEQALIDSEQRYQALFKSAPVPMWVFDTKTLRFLAVNQKSVEVYGYSQEEFLAMTTSNIRDKTELAMLRNLVDTDFADQTAPLRHRRKDGSEFVVNVMSTPIQYMGHAARFAVVSDVTAKVKAEKEVHDYLFTLQRSADATQAITWHQTLDGTMQEVAEQARGVIGAHQAIVSLTMGRDWAQAINALSLSEKYARYRDFLDMPDGSGIYALVCESNQAMRLTQAELEAHPRWRGFGKFAEAHPPMRGWLAVPLTGRSGKNIGLLQLSDKYEGEFTKQDEYVAIELAQLASIAIENAQLLEEVGKLNAGLEGKVAERTAALGRQEALFRALADQAPQVVWTANPRGEVTYLNQTWFDLAGGNLHDWSGSQWFAVLHPDDLPEVRANWLAAVNAAKPFVGIRRLMARDGSYHTMSYRASPVFDLNGDIEFWVGIDADVTEMKAIEAALRLSNQELEAFSYSVSHDLRSPLNTIDGFSRLLGKQLGSNPAEKVQHYLSRIQAGVAQMGRLIEDLLSLAQVTRVQLRYENVDVTQVASEILEDWRGRQPARKVTARVEPGLTAHGDARLVRVVMENLIGNAWKFTSQVADAEVTVGHSVTSAGDVVLFVRDNGAGFDMAYADKLFTAFQRLHAVSEFPGTGVGLATVSRVIARHGGRIWANSEPGLGATFCFTWPGIQLTVPPLPEPGVGKSSVTD
jgi:PAS domain S-box-containing protein